MCIKSLVLWEAVKQGWRITVIGLISICMACGSSPVEDESHEQNAEQPDLKDMVLIPAGEFLMGSREGEGAFSADVPATWADVSKAKELFLGCFKSRLKTGG